MTDKRRVLVSTAVSNSDTPPRGFRASPTVNGSAGSGVARVRAINNNASNGLSNSSSNTTTPTARSTPLVSSQLRETPGSALSPAARAAIGAKARVLRYDQQGATPDNNHSSSPLASSSRFNGPSTPSSNAYNGPITPGSGYTPVSASSSSTTPSTSVARAQVNTNGSVPGPSRPTPTSHLSSSSGVRKVRAASTPPVDDSPTVSRPVSPSKRRAFPAFPSSNQAGGADSSQQRSSSPSTSLGAPKMPRVRPISGPRSNTTGSPGFLTASRAGADPVKPPLHHSKSMTTRPPSAASNALLPSPAIRASPSVIFPPSSSSAVSAPTARVRPSPGFGNGQSPSPSTSAASASRPLSPVRMRPPSPVRPASPKRGEAFRPRSALSSTVPRRPEDSPFSKMIPTTVSPPMTSGISNAKRPSTSSQSSSSHSVATTADTSSTTTTTAATSFTSPDPKILSTSPDFNVRNPPPSSMNGYHRARRRSHSTNSSISSTSNLSSNVSKTKALSSTSTSGTTTRHSRSGSAGTNVILGMGINIPQVTSPTGSASNMAFSTSPIARGSLASPHRQTPMSPGKGFFSEAEKMEQQAHLDAKVHRKILDLEITNTSLLAINASLEKAKAKQSAELRELRRRMHDRSSFAPLSSSPGGGFLSPSSAELGGDISWSGDNEEEEKEMAWEDILKEDTKFADMVKLLEGMTRRGKEALEKVAAVPDRSVKSGPKVLSHFEIPADESIDMDRRLSGKRNQILMGSTMTSKTGTTEDDSTVGADSANDEEEDATTDLSEVNTSNTTESQNESSEASSSFEVSRGMHSNSEFSISID